MRGHKVRTAILAALTKHRKKVRKLHIKPKEAGAFHFQGTEMFAYFTLSASLPLLTTNTPARCVTTKRVSIIIKILRRLERRIKYESVFCLCKRYCLSRQSYVSWLIVVYTAYFDCKTRILFILCAFIILGCSRNKTFKDDNIRPCWAHGFFFLIREFHILLPPK